MAAAPTAGVMGALVLGMGMTLAACTPTHSAAHPSTSSSVPVTSAPVSSSTANPSGTTTSTTAAPDVGLGSNLPLFPFGSSREVAAWQQSYRSGGHEPWHLDAGQTAIAFAGFLGFPLIDKVTLTQTDGAGAHESVGFATGGAGGATTTSAVVHLVRWGTGGDAPWEVVGTDDTSFSLTMPAYGARVASPVTVGGLISGVDENIRVQVRESSTSSAGGYCCVPAGGNNSPWSASVPFTAPSGSVLTIVGQTGGHVAAVERFTVTGVRVR